MGNDVVANSRVDDDRYIAAKLFYSYADIIPLVPPCVPAHKSRNL
jgi:hypothetical protein